MVHTQWLGERNRKPQEGNPRPVKLLKSWLEQLSDILCWLKRELRGCTTPSGDAEIEFGMAENTMVPQIPVKYGKLCIATVKRTIE